MDNTQDFDLLKNLASPETIEIALKILDKTALYYDSTHLLSNFLKNINHKSGDGLPITPVYVNGSWCRARVNEEDFKASCVSQIGARILDVAQGRVNAKNIPTFYGANNKKTAVTEVLQEKDSGTYTVTIGIWKSENEFRVANLINGTDPDFGNLQFAHSMPRDYCKSFPEPQKTSALMLIDYFTNKFKQHVTPGLYNITNTISTLYSWADSIEGIIYGSVSDKFRGVNIAIPNHSKLKCVEVEEWKINKINNEEFEFELIHTGDITENGCILWQQEKD